MCGRFVITSAPAALRQLFGYIEQPNFPPRYNVAPTQPIPVVLVENGARHFRLMRWGLLPGWVKDPKGFTLLINARSETVLEKPAFKRAIRRRRGLIPADGYYEWKAVDGRKQPFFIHRADGEPLGFAAVFETWEEFRCQESEVRDLGDSVLWLGRVKMKGGASHVELDQEFAIHAVLRDGKVTAVRTFLAWEEALAAAGLPE